MQGNELQEFCWVGGMWKDSLEETRPAVNMDLHWGHYNELIQPMTNWTKHIHSLVSEQMTMIKYKDTSDIGQVQQYAIIYLCNPRLIYPGESP